MAYTTIDDPSAHFHTQLYTGNGSSGLSITNDANAGDFQADLLWIMPRSNGDNGVCFDSTRGSDKQLKLNGTDTEDTHSPARVTFESDGFDLDTTDTNYNGSSRTYVAWQWKCDGGTRATFTESSNNPGGGRQVNTTAGFSIIDYTGTGGAGTIAHGLGATPKFWVIKNRTGSGWSWYVYHGANTSAPETDNLYLNNTDATLDDNTRWNDTAPTSTNITLGTNGGVNEDGETLICYAWAEIQGYSKFGSYTGNADSNGTFVYTGFKTAWVMVKKTSAASTSWLIFDNKRPGYNGTGHRLYTNATDAEDTDTGDSVDLLSNGFKFRGGSSSSNADGATFVYHAFAEHPFVSSKGVPVTAR